MRQPQLPAAAHRRPGTGRGYSAFAGLLHRHATERTRQPPGRFEEAGQAHHLLEADPWVVAGGTGVTRRGSPVDTDGHRSDRPDGRAAAAVPHPGRGAGGAGPATHGRHPVPARGPTRGHRGRHHPPPGGTLPDAGPNRPPRNDPAGQDPIRFDGGPTSVRESMPWKPLLTVKGFRAAAGWRGWAEATRGCCGGNCDRQG